MAAGFFAGDLRGPVRLGRVAYSTRLRTSWRPASWRRASWRTWPPAWARAPSSASPWAWPRSAGAWRVSVGRSVARARTRVRHPRHRAGAVTGTPSRRWRYRGRGKTRLLLRRRLLGRGLLGRGLLGALLGRRGLLLGLGALERADRLEEVDDGRHRGGCVWVRDLCEYDGVTFRRTAVRASCCRRGAAVCVSKRTRVPRQM